MSMTAQLSDEEMVRYLQEIYGWEITGPFYTQVPEPLQKYIENNGESSRLIRNHLLDTYVIRDHFDMDHSKRREFMMDKENRQVTGWISKHSKLKGNRLFGVITSMSSIIDRNKKKHPNIYRSLEEIFTAELYRPLEAYNKMTFNDKLAYARKLDSAAYKFLEVLSV